MAQRTGWTLLIVANVLFLCVLSLYRTIDAAPPRAQQPFANAVEQRMGMIEELREIKVLLREQNALLRSGTLRVVVVDPEVVDPKKK